LGAGSSATINSANTMVQLDASNETASLGNAGDTVHFTAGASNDTLDASGAGVDAYGAGSFSINGNNDTFTNGATTTLDYTGTGGTFNVTGGSTVAELGSGSSASIVSAGTAVQMDGSNQTASLSNTGDTVDLAAGVTADKVDASNITIDISGDVTAIIDGSNDKVVGAADDNLTVTGTDDDVSATDSSVVVDGTNTGDDVVGAGDTGSNWAAPDPDDGSGDSGDPGDYGYGYGFAKWKGRAPDAAQVAKYAGASQSSVYEQASWADKTVTWSFAEGNQPTQSADPFSSYINTSSEEAAVEQAFQAWAKASGLNFVEVPDTATSDIRVGFGDLNTPTSNVIGLTSFSSADGQLNPGVVVRLEDPSQAPLITAANGQATYASTGTSLEQVALHEIGHALGLADNANADSVMDYLLSSSNQSLSSTDVAGIQSLYGSAASSTSASTSSVNSQLHQLVQAMASFDAGDGAWDTSESSIPAWHHNTVPLAATLQMSSHPAQLA